MKKLMICVDTNDYAINLFKTKLKEWGLKRFDEIHFVHGFKMQVYSDNYCLTSYPAKDQIEEIKTQLEDSLKKLANDLLGEESNRSVIECVFSTAPNEALKNYASTHHIDQMVIATRGKHGLMDFFASSFAEYMVRNATTQLLVLRN